MSDTETKHKQWQIVFLKNITSDSMQYYLCKKFITVVCNVYAKMSDFTLCYLFIFRLNVQKSSKKSVIMKEKKIDCWDIKCVQGTLTASLCLCMSVGAGSRVCNDCAKVLPYSIWIPVQKLHHCSFTLQYHRLLSQSY